MEKVVELQKCSRELPLDQKVYLEDIKFGSETKLRTENYMRRASFCIPDQKIEEQINCFSRSYNQIMNFYREHDCCWVIDENKSHYRRIHLWSKDKSLADSTRKDTHNNAKDTN